DTVTLNATADPGWRFDGWSGDATGTTNPLVLQLTGNTVVTATFSQEHYTLTTDVVGSGSVVPSPQQDSYVYGDVVTLVAEPTVGWSFVGWSDQGLGTDSTVQVTITGNTTISAIFAKNEYTIARTVIGSGNLTLAPEKTVYEHGDLVQFKATANAAGWVFARWEGDLTGTINPQSVTMERSLAVTAVFTKTRHTLTELTIGNGSLVVTPKKEFYFYGDNVTVTALPAAGWTLDGWSGDSTGRDNPITLVMDGNKSVIARFVEAPYQLTTTVAGQGTIKRSPDLQFFKDGDNVLLTAEAAPGWRFAGWTGALSGTENPVTVTMNSDKTVSANFVQIGYTVAVDVASTVANTDATANTVAIAPAKSSYSYGDLIT
ncbi:MAG: InlB B-repeat-containing protein, partial [Caldilineaceae bacterium]|nr:InlB B-repeat-containing protein [Caldilineaceae bacterium]